MFLPLLFVSIELTQCTNRRHRARGVVQALHDIVLVCFLVAFIVNLVHWKARQDERWQYFPRGGGLLAAITVCIFVLWLTCLIPLRVAAAWVMFYMTILQMYSILFRHRQRRILQRRNSV
jgi:hypothetical protein